MVQWRVQSLFLLVSVFLTALIVFNGIAFHLGPSFSTLPFTPNSRGYSLHISNLSRSSIPLSIEAYPLTSNSSYLSVWCGEEAEVNDYVISLKRPYYVSIFSMCKDMTVEIWPRHENVGFYARGQKFSYFLIVFLTRIAFLAAILFTFYLLFKHKKNFSVMRSTLIIQISCAFILDPFTLLQSVIPSISLIHCFISAIGWWRGCSEVFIEYGPLVRPQTSFYKYIIAVPAVILFVTTSFETFCRYTFPNFMFWLGTVGGLVVPVLSIWFLFKAGNTTGKTALFVHIIGGTVAMSICYFMKVLANCSETFRDSLVCQTLEISFIGAYALFHTILQAGENYEESTRLLPQNVNRYDKIDELLDVLGDIGDDPHFDMDQEEEDELSQEEEK